MGGIAALRQGLKPLSEWGFERMNQPWGLRGNPSTRRIVSAIRFIRIGGFSAIVASIEGRIPIVFVIFPLSSPQSLSEEEK